MTVAPKRAAASLVIACVIGCGTVAGAEAAIPVQWKNCAHVNQRYPHGVGRVGAHDKTTGAPVTNFKRSTRLYRLGMSYNRGLDRDNDGTCEK